jgi:hypothetical protein
MFPTTKVPQLYFDMINTPTRLKLAQLANGTKSVYALDDFYTLQDKTPLKSPEELFNPGVTYTQNNQATKFSNPVSSCVKLLAQIVDPVKVTTQLNRGWAPANIAIVSNGFCGSTCGQFVRTMRDSLNIQSFTYGGPSGNTPLQPTSFEAGSVATFSDLSTVNLAKNSTSPLPSDSPGFLPLPVTGGVAIWQSFSPKDQNDKNLQHVPIEFIPKPAEKHLNGMATTDPVAIWKQVEMNMPTTSQGGAKNAVITNNNGGNGNNAGGGNGKTSKGISSYSFEVTALVFTVCYFIFLT